MPSQVSDTVDDFYAEAVRFLSHNRYVAAQDNLSEALFTVPLHRGVKSTSTLSNPVGIHWTDVPKVAEKFARAKVMYPNERGSGRVIHGKVNEKAIVDRKSKEGRTLRKIHGIESYENEHENTVRPGATVLVTGSTRITHTVDPKGKEKIERRRERRYNPPRQVRA